MRDVVANHPYIARVARVPCDPVIERGDLLSRKHTHSFLEQPQKHHHLFQTSSLNHQPKALAAREQRSGPQYHFLIHERHLQWFYTKP